MAAQLPLFKNKLSVTFLDLPRELRDVIYNHVLAHDSHILLLQSVYTGPTYSLVHKTTVRTIELCEATSNFAALRATCRQVDQEAQHQFFARNIFNLVAHQSRYEHVHLDSAAARFILAGVRRLVVEYTAPVSGDLSGFFCVRMIVLLQNPIDGNDGWQARPCTSYDHRHPPRRVYQTTMEAISRFLSSDIHGESLGSGGLKAIIDTMQREVQRVI